METTPKHRGEPRDINAGDIEFNWAQAQPCRNRHRYCPRTTPVFYAEHCAKHRADRTAVS